MSNEEELVVTRRMIRRLEDAQLENHEWSLGQTHWMKSSKRGRWTTTIGSFVDSGRVTAAAEEECREPNSDVRPAGRKTRF